MVIGGVVAAKTYKTQLANAVKFAPELAVIQAHPALFAKLATYTNPAAIPPKLVGQAVAAAGGGAEGTAIPTTIRPTAPPSAALSRWRLSRRPHRPGQFSGGRSLAGDHWRVRLRHPSPGCHDSMTR